MKCQWCGNQENPRAWINEYELRRRTACFICTFWMERLEADQQDPATRGFTPIIYDGKHMMAYSAGVETFVRGFGGLTFRISYSDGSQVVSDNVWDQGIIPLLWRPAFMELRPLTVKVETLGTDGTWSAFK